MTEAFFEIMNTVKNVLFGIILFSIVVMIVIHFAGCSTERYKIEYSNKNAFLLPKNSAIVSFVRS